MNIGLTLEEQSADRLCQLLGTLGDGGYLKAFGAVAAQDRKRWIADRSDALALVERLSSLTASPQSFRPARPSIPASASQRGELL
jgi:succinoglycan biosynthesis protein ExoA